ncbi:DUF4286 family protein [uncultured Shewanella sp.]|uniref:DUF4286 family protein n=1 Tax=uncultured Shewanella sp. TaxID=173975 RepID=UPI00261CBD34|nr:DUF4286 family protein [uncultured Shewanella sp.]
MVIYQVELKIENDIAKEYLEWLTPHMEKMMSFNGFLKVDLYEDLTDKEEGNKRYTVIYHLASEADLQAYLSGQAQAMRDEGIKLFGGRCQASRKVCRLKKSLS